MTADIFEGVELCDWPVKRSSDTWSTCTRMVDQIHRQNWYLSGFKGYMKWSRTGTRWYVEIGGIYYCQLRLFDIALTLNDAGATTFKASSAEEAIRIYQLYASVMFKRKFDSQIGDLLKRAVVR